MVLMRGNDISHVLYFKFKDKAYDLTGEVVDLPPDRLLTWEGSHGIITSHCLHILKSSKIWSTVDTRYAVTYWAQHLAKSDYSGHILEELHLGLQETTPERRSTATDASLVIQWLKACYLFMFIPRPCTNKKLNPNRKPLFPHQRPNYCPYGIDTTLTWNLTCL